MNQREIQQRLDELSARTVERASADGLEHLTPAFETVVGPTMDALAARVFAISLVDEAPSRVLPEACNPLGWRSACGILIGFAIPGLLMERAGGVLGLRGWVALFLAATLVVLSLHRWPRAWYRFTAWRHDRRARKREQARAWAKMQVMLLTSEYRYFRGLAESASKRESLLQPGVTTTLIDDLIQRENRRNNGTTQ